MPARGGHFRPKSPKLLGGSSFHFLGFASFFLCSCWLGGSSHWLGFSCFCRCCSWSSRCRWCSGWCWHRCASVGGGESASGEQGGNQRSKKFVHLKFPVITLFKKALEKFVDLSVTAVVHRWLTPLMRKFWKRICSGQRLRVFINLMTLKGYARLPLTCMRVVMAKAGFKS